MCGRDMGHFTMDVEQEMSHALYKASQYSTPIDLCQECSYKVRGMIEGYENHNN